MPSKSSLPYCFCSSDVGRCPSKNLFFIALSSLIVFVSCQILLACANMCTTPAPAVIREIGLFIAFSAIAAPADMAKLPKGNKTFSIFIISSVHTK